jgi:hypothetical protein
MIYLRNVFTFSVMSSYLSTQIETTIANILSKQLLTEILTELNKYDVWKSNLLCGLVKSKQAKPINRDQLVLFIRAEWLRLTEAMVHLQFVFVPRLLHPEQDIQTPFVVPAVGGSVLTEHERRIERELNKLNEWILKRDELQKRFREYLVTVKSKIPVHKQDHDPVRRCPNPRCCNIALFKHTPDSLVCISCGMSQRYLDNNIAYGEEVEWTDSKSKSKKVAATNLDLTTDAVTVHQLLTMPYLLNRVPKKFDLSVMFHYNVQSPTPVSVAQNTLTKEMLQTIEGDAECKRWRTQWATKPSAVLWTKVGTWWKRHLKHIQFAHTPAFVCTGTFVILQWTPPAILHQQHAEISQSLYLFDTALIEYQTLHPDHPVSNIRASNFRKYALFQIVQLRQTALHLLHLINLSKHDKLNRLYDTAFQLVCHYIDTKKET